MLEIAIFSYNRKAHLENCLASVARHLPGPPVTIFDDDSDDPETQAFLATVEAAVRRPSQVGEGRNGGLYNNMQLALETSSQEFLLCLQDDTQLVRPVGQDDLNLIQNWFQTNPNAAFLCPLFLKGITRKARQNDLKPVPGFRLYRDEGAERLKPRSATKFYTDISIAHVGRLRAANWRYGPSETATAERARGLFDQLTFAGDPFLFFCPEVPTHRNRRKTLGARLAERLVGPDVKSFRDMTGNEIQALKSRPLSELPFAEDLLETHNPNVRRPFAYSAVNSRLWTRILNKAERKLRP